MTDENDAPSCPISHSQDPTNPRGLPTKLPSIPIATDLESLIRAINILRDILRGMTTSLTINNTYYGQNQPPKQYAGRTYLMSDYDADWYQTKIEPKLGVIYNKTAEKVDTKQRAFVERIDAVQFRNNARDNDQSFEMRYVKQPDGPGSDQHLFEEDFFERIVNVHWKKEELEYFTISWNLNFRGDSHYEYSQEVCETPTSPSHWSAYYIDGSNNCDWHWDITKMFESPGAIFSGEPTANGGSAANCILPHVYSNVPYLAVGLGIETIWPPRVVGGPNVTSFSFPIIAQAAGTDGCYGEPPIYYPSGFVLYRAQHGVAPSRYWVGNEGPIPGSNVMSPYSYDLVDTCTITANITARAADDGKPLKKEGTQIAIQKYGGNVVVTFSRPKKSTKPSGTP